MTNHTVTLPHRQLAAFCQKYHVRRLSLFGSVLRDDFGPDSDIDILIEFEEGQTVDLFTFADMQAELATLLGREVDLNTPGFLSRYFRQKVIDTAQVVYERAG